MTTVRQALQGKGYTCPACGSYLSISRTIDPSTVDVATIGCPNCGHDQTFDRNEFGSPLPEYLLEWNGHTVVRDDEEKYVCTLCNTASNISDSPKIEKEKQPYANMYTLAVLKKYECRG